MSPWSQLVALFGWGVRRYRLSLGVGFESLKLTSLPVFSLSLMLSVEDVSFQLLVLVTMPAYCHAFLIEMDFDARAQQAKMKGF